MKNKSKNIFGIFLIAGCVLALFLIAKIFYPAEESAAINYGPEVQINFSEDGTILIDDEEISSNEKSSIFLNNDIVYHKDINTYESGNIYGQAAEDEKHSETKAQNVKVINIVKPGTYRLTGKLNNGQIKVNLSMEDIGTPEGRVALILDNAEINCDIAPAIFFQNVYECHKANSLFSSPKNKDLTSKNAYNVNTDDTGAIIVIADNSYNKINGSHVATIYHDTPTSTVKHEYDAAIYSQRSLKIAPENDGTGVLEVCGDKEGISASPYVTIDGANINITSNEDAINANSDNVSVVTINAGTLRLNAAKTGSGDAIDSNGWIVVNGGIVVGTSGANGDCVFDSDCGTIINGGTLLGFSNTEISYHQDSEQNVVELYIQSHERLSSSFVVKEGKKVIFAYEPLLDKIFSTDDENIYNIITFSSPELKGEKQYSFSFGAELDGENNNGIFLDDSTKEIKAGKFFSQKERDYTNVNAFKEKIIKDFSLDKGLTAITGKIGTK